MKTIKTLSVAAVTALTLMSASAFAESVSVTASTLDSAEAQIAAKAHEEGMNYKITSADTKNNVHMTAELYK